MPSASSVSPSKTAQSSPEPEPPDQGSDGPKPPFPWWLLIAAAALALILWRFLITEPTRRAKRHPDQGAEILFDASLSLLAMGGLRRQPQETMHDFACRAEKSAREKGLPSLAHLTDKIAGQIYGRHAAEPRPFAEAYLSLRRSAPAFHRFRAVMKRMFTRTSAAPAKPKKAPKPRRQKREKKKGKKA